MEDYQTQQYKYCLMSYDYSNMLDHWMQTQINRDNLYKPDITPDNRNGIQNWIRNEGEHLLVTGIYHWGRVLADGFDKVWIKPEDILQDEYESYDIIHINYYGLTEHLVGDVREVIGWDSNTKIVTNIDYAPGLWGRCPEFKKPRALLRDLDLADMVFATTDEMASILEYALGREIPVIPHPAAVKELKQLHIPHKEREDHHQERAPIAIVNIHSWDALHYFPSWALRFSNDGPLDYVSVLTNIKGGDQEMFEKATVLYAKYLNSMPYSKFMQFVRTAHVSIDSYSEYSYGRYTVDTACLGVPNISFTPVESQHKLWPELTTGVYDVKKQHELLKRLRHDMDFYDEVVAYAQEAVEEFNYKNSRRKFLQALFEDSVPK